VFLGFGKGYGHYEKDIQRGDKGAGTYILDVETKSEKQTRKVVVQ